VFTPNVGQFDPTVKFAVEGNNCNQLGTDTGTVYMLAEPYGKSAEKQAQTASLVSQKLYLYFLDANLSPDMTTGDQVSWNNNYFIGNNPEQWFSDVPNYKHILLSDIYDGIDLTCSSNDRRIDFEIIIHPDSDPSQIVFRHTDYDSISEFSVNENGELTGYYFIRLSP